MKKFIYVALVCSLFACKAPNSSYSLESDKESVSVSQTREISEELTVSDGDNSYTLTFGTGNEQTEGFDSDIDVESPPFTPPGAFYAHFNIPDHKLYKDIKSNSSKIVEWHIEFAPERERQIELRWSIGYNALKPGSLTLQDNLQEPTVSIDMISENSFAITDSLVKEMFIVYNASGNKTSTKKTDANDSESEIEQKNTHKMQGSANTNTTGKRHKNLFKGETKDNRLRENVTSN